MAVGSLVIGPTGSGKTYSMFNLSADDTIIINVTQKPLSYSKPDGFFFFENPPLRAGAIVELSNIKDIISIMITISDNFPNVKNIIVDDFSYLGVKEYMDRIDEKSFDKFNDIGKIYWAMGRLIPTLRRNLNVFIMAHDETEVDSFGVKTSKFKTIGKLTDKMIVFEGLFTIVLYAYAITRAGEKTKYIFRTQNDGSTTAKSPHGMFELEIPNDLAAVSNRITEFYS